jgi:hypothetical protein
MTIKRSTFGSKSFLKSDLVRIDIAHRALLSGQKWIGDKKPGESSFYTK